jgi:tripartite-type tricarboxylate transporter receptor subunit TctC
MERRSPGLPDAPIFHEAGVKGSVISQWMGVFVPVKINSDPNSSKKQNGGDENART